MLVIASGTVAAAGDPIGPVTHGALAPAPLFSLNNVPVLLALFRAPPAGAPRTAPPGSPPGAPASPQSGSSGSGSASGKTVAPVTPSASGNGLSITPTGVFIDQDKTGAGPGPAGLAKPKPADQTVPAEAPQAPPPALTPAPQPGIPLDRRVMETPVVPETVAASDSDNLTATNAPIAAAALPKPPSTFPGYVTWVLILAVLFLLAREFQRWYFARRQREMEAELSKQRRA